MSEILEITADGLYLPKSLVEQFGWHQGTKVMLEIHDRAVSIVPQELTAEDIAEIACIFLLEKVGDAVAIKKPQKKDEKWIVDVILPHARKDLGALVFTANGKLISDESSNPSKLLEKANEN
jgi:antitoxin component of MazEF toxin-antitoxin module